MFARSDTRDDPPPPFPGSNEDKTGHMGSRTIVGSEAAKREENTSCSFGDTLTCYSSAPN